MTALPVDLQNAVFVCLTAGTHLIVDSAPLWRTNTANDYDADNINDAKREETMMHASERGKAGTGQALAHCIHSMTGLRVVHVQCARDTTPDWLRTQFFWGAAEPRVQQRQEQ